MKQLIIIMIFIATGCSTLQSPKIHTAPQGGRVVIFDIDGTLTPRPIEIWEARPGAAITVQSYADKACTIIYLSARLPGLQLDIPTWLRENGFPVGYIYVPESIAESSAPADFKTKVLKQIIVQGWKIVAAYGDSTTDFEAYSAVGIPKQAVFALKRDGGSTCEEGIWSKCMSGWK